MKELGFPEADLSNPRFLYLSDRDVKELNPGISTAVEAVSGALNSLSLGMAEMPPKPGIFTREGALLHAMPAFLRDRDICGAKWVSSYPGNPAKGFPRVAGFQILNDPDTGLPLCLMDCRWITLARTAALSALFVRHCATDSSRSLAILGAGAQGAFHLRAFGELFAGIRAFTVYDLDLQRAEEFVAGAKRDTGIVGRVAADVRDAISGADIVLSAGVLTPSVCLGWMKPGCIGIGLDMARVWQDDVFEGADGFITDSKNQLRVRKEKESGTFRGDLAKVRAELGDILTGRARGRLAPEERLVFVSTGLAVNDLALAHAIYEKALGCGAGTYLPL